MTDEPCSSALRAWACLNRTQQAAMSRVERALKAAGLPPVAWYEVLVELDRGGGCGLRPFALEQALLLPQYGLSRLLARMEAAGLVARGSCPDDGRGQMVALTDAGRAMRQRMWPVYAGAVQEAVGTRLPEGEAAALAELLGKLGPPAEPQRGTAGPGAALSE